MATAAPAVRERPIIFSGEMVRAILENRKTQTRRVVKAPKLQFEGGCDDSLNDPSCWSTGWYDPSDGPWSDLTLDEVRCPYGVRGERLWVRETWSVNWHDLHNSTGVYQLGVGYKADDAELTFTFDRDRVAEIGAAQTRRRGQWRSPIHMPRWASRLTLEITDLRVERLQEISRRDAKAEGAFIDWPNPPSMAHASWRMIPGDTTHHATTIDAFRHAWDRLNAKRGYGWDANPWVWVVTFKRVEG